MGKRVPNIVIEIRYIRDRARGVMGRLKIQSDSYRNHEDVTSVAKAIAADANLVRDILSRLAQLGEKACGRIVAMGKGYPTQNVLKEFPFLKDCAPRDVWADGWLPENGNGWLLLHRLATASLIGAIALNIYEDLKKE
ncbi:MAG TPA: hypothetical protein VJH94_02295 [Candidatus Paceibacterota bacterium]